MTASPCYNPHMDFQRESIVRFLASASPEELALYLFFQTLVLAYIIGLGRWLVAAFRAERGQNRNEP
jgi:hypothetical protein